MLKICSIKTKHIGLIIILIGSWLPITLAAANKIVVVAGDENSERVQALKQGFVTGMGLQFDFGAKSYALDSGYVIEFESDVSKMLTTVQKEDVITVVCDLSVVCAEALDKDAPTDVLVVTIGATSNKLREGSNILRLAPANDLQARLMYNHISEDIGFKRFAIVYEPDIYAMDFYSLFLSDYFMDIVLAESKPTFVAAIPLHSFVINLDENYKSIKVDVAVDLLRTLQIDAVAYFGFPAGFTALTNSESGGDASVAKYWYASDAVYETAKGFANLKVYATYRPNTQESTFQEYYYAYDAGIFLSKVIANYQPQNTPNRSNFLQIAQETALEEEETKTGAKSFTSADKTGRFNVKVFDEQGQVKVKDITVNGF
jgi:hypothetical protein